MTKLKSAKLALSLIEEYLNTKAPVSNRIPPQDLEKTFDTTLPEIGKSDAELQEKLTSYLFECVKTKDPLFFNQLWSGFSEAGLTAEMISTATNTSMYTFEVAPAATLIEKELITNLLTMIGFDSGEGVFTTGGTASNISALLAARNIRYPQGIKTGFGDQGFVIYTSTASHYSIVKAGNIIGIGTDNVIKVATDKNDKMIPCDLLNCVQSSIAEGKTPLAVVATAGTTVAGTYDPISEISDICEEHDIWLHVDGAWGGTAMFHPDHKYKLDGLDRANSYTWDAHKMLGLPLVCSTLFMKEKGHLKAAHTHGTGDDYLFHDEAKAYDLGHNSIQCGRRFDSLKLWLLWQMKGLKGIQDMVAHCFDMAEYFAQNVAALEGFEIYSTPEAPAVCFRYVPEFPNVNIDDLNIALRNALIKNGEVLINYGRVNGDIVLRIVTVNPDLQTTHLDTLLHHLERCAGALDVKASIAA